MIVVQNPEVYVNALGQILGVDPAYFFDDENVKLILDLIQYVCDRERKVHRIENMYDLFAHLITTNSDRPFNEVWDVYFGNLHKTYNIGNMTEKEVRQWLAAWVFPREA